MGNRVRHDRGYPCIDESNGWYERGRKLIPSCTQTLAKGPTQHVDGVCPKYIERGHGGHVYDVDGNEYIDFQMGIGPLSLGYCHPEVDEAIREQLRRGITFSQMHPLEVEVAELVHEVVPHADMVRFSKTGADVTSAAVRLARAFTGRERVVCCGYHGWHDWYVGTTTRARGVPEAVRGLTTAIPYNDVEAACAAIHEGTACVIVEPMGFEAPRNEFLHRLRAACSDAGALLIFDEMWTGFRLALGGAQEHFDVGADLACFSKAVANGMPISVLTGRRDVMSLLDEDVFFYTTFGGEALSLAAAKATLNVMRREDVVGVLERRGRRLRDGFNAIAEGLGLVFVRCIGHGARTMVTFDGAAADPLLMKSFVQQELIRHGILWGGFHVMCFMHDDADIEYALEAYADVLERLGRVVRDDKLASALRGTPVAPVFRKQPGS